METKYTTRFEELKLCQKVDDINIDQQIKMNGTKMELRVPIGRVENCVFKDISDRSSEHQSEKSS